jgi:hypothetical protein
MTIWWASRPWLMAFLEERSLPWTVIGPAERAPLALEARMRLSEDIKTPNYRIERGVKGFGVKCFVCGEKSLKWEIGGEEVSRKERKERKEKLKSQNKEKMKTRVSRGLNPGTDSPRGKPWYRQPAGQTLVQTARGANPGTDTNFRQTAPEIRCQSRVCGGNKAETAEKATGKLI